MYGVLLLANTFLQNSTSLKLYLYNTNYGFNLMINPERSYFNPYISSNFDFKKIHIYIGAKTNPWNIILVKPGHQVIKQQW